MVQRQGGKRASVPVALLDVAPVAQNFAVQGDHHAQSQFGHGVGVDPRGVENGNPPAAGGLDIHRVVPGPPADHRLQIGLVGQNGFRGFQDADDDAVHIGEGLIVLLAFHGEG